MTAQTHVWTDEFICTFIAAEYRSFVNTLPQFIAEQIMRTIRDEMQAVIDAQEQRIAELAAPQWEPVSQSLEYDLITHAIKHGEIPQGYRIYRSKEPMS